MRNAPQPAATASAQSVPGQQTVAIVVPVFHDSGKLRILLDSIESQVLPEGYSSPRLLIVETEHQPTTEELCLERGADYSAIPASDFDHGGTRSRAARDTSADILVFLSQDVELTDERALARLIEPLDQDQVAAAYGRQLPPHDASRSMKLKRAFSYPEADALRAASAKPLQHRDVLFSNAFGAYRRSALAEIDWFGERRLMCEDVEAAAALLDHGYAVRYVADAAVIHRHAESVRSELARSFDIGASHELMIRRSQVPPPRSLGTRFVWFGLRRLSNPRDAVAIPGFLLHAVLRWAAYRLGRSHRRLPAFLVRAWSLQPTWWRRTSS